MWMKRQHNIGVFGVQIILKGVLCSLNMRTQIVFIEIIETHVMFNRLYLLPET